MIYISQIELPDTFVSDVISGFNTYQHAIETWEETDLIRINDIFTRETDPFLYDKLVELSLRVQSLVAHDVKYKSFFNVEVVRYPTSSAKQFHFDYPNPNKTAASITYLNDNYIGGQTVIDGVSVQPLSGRTVYFTGQDHRHCVMNVVKGCRYTLSIWYGHDEGYSI